jgi:uncharacterized protein YprB with RNaseH-like and TPR domain
MSINPYKLRKDDLIKFFVEKCEHRHTYHEHPNCFIKDNNVSLKTGFLDIETNGFYPAFHVIGSYAIKEENSDKIYGRYITPKELRSDDFDKNIVKDCIADMLKFDRIITYYGTKFDIPYIRTVALEHKLDDFPIYGVIKHIDMYYIVKYKLRLHRRSLEEACRVLGIEGKSHVDGKLWKKAFLHADEKCFKEIFEHNKQDTIILEKVFHTLQNYSIEPRRSV